MPHYPSNEPDDAWDDDALPDDSDNESATIRCPACDAEVYEDAVQCPSCGEYLAADTSAWSGRPTWWIILGLVGVLATILALAGLLPW